MDKKLMIYPFNKRVSAVARYARLLKGYILTVAVSPKSYGYEGKDISFVDGGEFAGIAITSSFQEGLDQCDSILFSASTFLVDLNYYVEKIREAVNYGKEVLISKALEEDIISNQGSIPTGVKVLGNNPVQKKASYDKTKYVREISVPVMTIFQIGEFCNGFGTQLVLSQKFEKEGYRVSKVSSSGLGELFGIHMLPDYIYEHHVSYEDKIINFNQFLISIVENENPDILLLEIAEAILPYSDRITNHFGVTPGIIAKAVLADVSILNIYYDTFDKVYLNHLKAFCRYTLNAEIGYINIANETMVVKETDSSNPIHYVSVDRNTVLQAIDTCYNEYDCVFFNTYDLCSVESAFYHIVDKLSQNKEIVRIW